MKHQRHFGTTTSREAAQTKALIADLGRIVQILDDAISAEEELAGVSDHSQADYPMHARQMAARRDNLTDTVAALERRLAGLLERTEQIPAGRKGEQPVRNKAMPDDVSG